MRRRHRALKRRYGHATKRGLERRAREEANLVELERLVRADAYSETPKLRVGQKIGRRSGQQLTVTAVGTHTVQYKTADGWSGSLQIPWSGSTGEMLPSHRRALKEVGGYP